MVASCNSVLSTLNSSASVVSSICFLIRRTICSRLRALTCQVFSSNACESISFGLAAMTRTTKGTLLYFPQSQVDICAETLPGIRARFVELVQFTPGHFQVTRQDIAPEGFRLGMQAL